MENRSSQLHQINQNLEKEISERIKAEMALDKLNRELRAISNCNQVLVRAVDEQELLSDICRIICEEAGYKLSWVGYVEYDAAKSVRPVAWYGYDDGYSANANITWDDQSERGRGATGRAIRSGCSVYSQDLLNDPNYKPWVKEAIKRGFQSSIALPLKNEDGEVFGALMLYSSEPYAITPEELRMLEELAGDLAFGITSLRIRNERKRAMEALQVSEAHYHSLFDRVKDGVYRSTREGRFVDINPAMVEMFGYSSKEEMMKVDIKKELYFSLEDREKGYSDESQQHTEVYRMRRKDNSEIWVEDNGRFEYDEVDDTIYHEGILRDVTERIKAEKELIKAKENAELSDRLKTEFLHNISHEIRTPMNAISGFTHILNTPDLTPSELAEYTSIVQSNIDQLISIITDIITISSLETNQEKVILQLININDILDEKAFLYKDRLKEQNCSLFIEKSLKDVQALIYTDGTKVSTVFNHLLSNALKFTKNGSIWIGYTLNGSELAFYVKDTGLGIEHNMLDCIFDAFRKAKQGSIIDTNGTGLGLSISKGYVELLGGTISVESVLGQGSTFRFTIPYTPAQ